MNPFIQYFSCPEMNRHPEDTICDSLGSQPLAPSCITSVWNDSFSIKNDVVKKIHLPLPKQALLRTACCFRPNDGLDGRPGMVGGISNRYQPCTATSEARAF